MFHKRGVVAGQEVAAAVISELAAHPKVEDLHFSQLVPLLQADGEVVRLDVAVEIADRVQVYWVGGDCLPSMASRA